MVSRPDFLSDFGLLRAGTEVLASGANRFFMVFIVFGDGIRAVVALAGSVFGRR